MTGYMPLRSEDFPSRKNKLELTSLDIKSKLILIPVSSYITRITSFGEDPAKTT